MIEVDNLTKRYGDLCAVYDLSFSVEPGEILGFLGPNGAGKSTTMKMISGYLRPSKGSVSIYGKDMWTQTLEAQCLIGNLPEGAPAYEEMTVEAFLGFICEARGIENSRKEDALNRSIEMMSLEPVANQRIQTISKGFKRRVGLAQAILHDPKVLILDEPTDGLDPNQKHDVRDMIRNLSTDKIVIVSTHILEEVSAVCNRAIILNNGRIVSDSDPMSLLEKSKYHGAVTLETKPDKVSELAEMLSRQLFVSGSEKSGRNLTVFPVLGDRELLVKLNDFLREHDFPVSSLRSEEGRLDEVFRNLTKEEPK